MLRIRKNDIVYVLSGRDRGKKGKVLTVNPKENRALVEGINFIKKHIRRSSQEQQGGIVQMEAPIHISNLAIYCPQCSRPTRIGVRVLEDKARTRFCKKCKEPI